MRFFVIERHAHRLADFVHGGPGHLAGAGRACLKNIPGQAWIVLIFLAPLLHGIEDLTSASAAQPLHSMQPMPAERQPSSTFTIVSRSLKILCRSPTGQTSGLPGSVRRTRAGSVTMVFSFCRTTGSGSVSRMVLPYDFDILRPSVPGSFGAGVSSGCGSGKTCQ